MSARATYAPGDDVVYACGCGSRVSAVIVKRDPPEAASEPPSYQIRVRGGRKERGAEASQLRKAGKGDLEEREHALARELDAAREEMERRERRWQKELQTAADKASRRQALE